MIRINLLPVRAAKKKETAQQQIAVFVISIVVVAALVLSILSLTLVKINMVKNGIQSSEAELKVLKTKIGEMDNIKKLQDEVKKKLDVLNRLRREKSGPAERLAKLSDSIPEKVWLTKYSEASDNVSISGIAYNEDLIAELIRNLLASQVFSNVELLVSEQMDVGGVKAKRFDLACTIFWMKKEEPKAKK